MLRVIDGKRYNTDTAELLCNYDNGKFRSDFGYRSKTLYRTAKGAYFLHHEGGPMTDMARSCGSSTVCGSEDIEPVSMEDARRFLEAHSDQDDAQEALDRYFADVIEDA